MGCLEDCVQGSASVSARTVRGVLDDGVGRHRDTPLFDYDDELSGSRLTSQMEALYYLVRGRNVLLCGQAGSGKSWVVNAYRRIVEDNSLWFEKNGRVLNMAVTASTGIAATLIGGRTIHSWSGLGVSFERFNPATMPSAARKVWNRARKRIRDTDILIIDEVSMLPAFFLDNLDAACREAKNKPGTPFGGIQIVLVGDFLQLPPVDRGTDIRADGSKPDKRFCFHSQAFRDAHFTPCYLDRSRRADDGDRLVDVLNAIRNRNVTSEIRELLNNRVHANTVDNDDTVGIGTQANDVDNVGNGNTAGTGGHVYTRLYTVNRRVDEENMARLERLPGSMVTVGYHVVHDPIGIAKQLVRDERIASVSLKPGARVMLTSNNAIPGMVNGSLGTVVGFNWSNGIIGQVDSVRVRFNNGLVEDVHPVSSKRSHGELVSGTDDDGMPILQEVEVVDAEVMYMPLRLAWCITVHKSQGQTLDGAVIDLSKCFQPGLGYVALSRVSRLDDIVLEHHVTDEVFQLDPDALRMDRMIRESAAKYHERFIQHERWVEDMQRLMDSGSMPRVQERKTRKSLDESPSVRSLFADDESTRVWLNQHRTRHMPVRRGKKTK